VTTYINLATKFNDAGLKDAQKSLDNFGKTIGVAFAATAAAVATAGVALSKFGADAINSASAFSAEFEGVNQVFGSAASSVQAFAETAARTVGITETAALQAAKGFGVFASAAGLSGQSAADFSTKLVQAAGDMASFNDVPVEETLAAIKSGLQGQGEPLSKFGILMNEATLKAAALEAGIIDSTKNALTPQQKVLAANALIFEQLGVQQGDFVAYQDTFGNKIKTVTAILDEMKTEIGVGLLPQAEELLGTFEENIIPIFEDLASNVGPMLSSWMETITKIIDDAGDPTTFFGQSVQTLTESFATLMEVLTASESDMEGATDSLGSVANAVAVLIEILASLIAFLETVGPAFEALLKGDFETFFDWLRSDPVEWRKLNVTTNYTETGTPPKVDYSDSIGYQFSQGMGPGQTRKTPTITGGTTGGGAPKKQDNTKAIAETMKQASEAIGKAQQAYRKAVSRANSDYKKAVDSSNKAFAEAAERALETRTKALTSLAVANAESVARINSDFSKRLADIVKGSINRLRDVYRAAVEVNIAQLFGARTVSQIQTQVVKITDGIRTTITDQTEKTVGGSVDDLVRSLRKKLQDSRDLLSNASRLAAEGFSQTFIEQIVGAGTETGNELANAILEATPQTREELKTLFRSIESESNKGMDKLAQSIYDGAGLATDELKQLYADTLAEQSKALTDQAALYAQQQAEVMAQFDLAMIEAATIRDEALKAAMDAYSLALKKAAEDFLLELDEIEKKFKAKLKELGAQKAQIEALQREIDNARNNVPSVVSNTPVVPVTSTNKTGSTGTTINVNVKTDATQSTAQVGKTIAKTVAKLTTSGGGGGGSIKFRVQ
jgi:hypothetical protein